MGSHLVQLHSNSPDGFPRPVGRLFRELVQIFGVEPEFFQHRGDTRGSLVVLGAVEGHGQTASGVVGAGDVIVARGRSTTARMASRLR